MINLGSILQIKGDLAGAERWYRKAAETDPSFAMAHVSLGQRCSRTGDLAGAEAAYRKLVELNPKSASARSRLADVERWSRCCRGSTTWSPAGPSRPTRPRPSASPGFAARLPAVATPPPSGSSTGPSPRIPKLSDEQAATHRYDAACHAARAGCGQGSDASADSAGRAALRGKALGWLRADLALRARQADSDKPADRRTAADSLLYWLDDSNLAAVSTRSWPNRPAARRAVGLGCTLGRGPRDARAGPESRPRRARHAEAETAPSPGR